MTSHQNRQPPWEGEKGKETASFGTWLRRQREIREVPLAEISDATKISIRYLEAMEQDRFDVLPASVFAKGFLREYAKFVGLDPDEVVNSYLTALQESDESPETEEPRSSAPSTGRGGKTEKKGSWLLVVALIVALLLVAFLIYWGSTQSGGEAEVPTIAAPVLPAPPVQEVGEAPVRTAPLLVTIDFIEDCWVELTVDGERRISELHVQGESMRLEAEEEIRLTLGNPTGVRVEVNGQLRPLRAGPGQVERDLVLRASDFAPAVESSE